jgi:hypothetical protein
VGRCVRKWRHGQFPVSPDSVWDAREQLERALLWTSTQILRHSMTEVRLPSRALQRAPRWKKACQQHAGAILARRGVGRHQAMPFPSFLRTYLGVSSVKIGSRGRVAQCNTLSYSRLRVMAPAPVHPASEDGTAARQVRRYTHTPLKYIYLPRARMAAFLFISAKGGLTEALLSR